MQAPGFTQNFNRYSYALNNPLRFTDPSGEFFFIFPTISWSKHGGISIGFSVVVGIPGIASAQARIEYNIKNNDFSAYVGATAAFNTVYASASTSNGFSVGWAAGISPQVGFPISTNLTSAGVNYNITHDNWSGNVSAWGVDEKGWTFDPSVSAMFLEEQTTNLVRGQGFRNNDEALSRFVANGQQQRALDYFGFKGKYAPNNELFKLQGAGDAIWDPESNGIYYRDNAFQHGYDYLYAAYAEERFHSIDYHTYKNNVPEGVHSLHDYEEWRAQMHLYKNLGLYTNSGNNWVERIRQYGQNAGMYYPVVGSNFSYSVTFYPKWWHFIYKIPRRW